MATLLSTASGSVNFSASSTWSLVESGTYVDSRATSVALSTTPQTNNFTLGSTTTVQGIAIQFNGIPATGYNITLELFNVTDSVSVTSVVVSSSVLASATSGSNTFGYGWLFFKFGTTYSLLNTKTYQIRLSVNATTGVGFSAWASSGTNFSRALVTTTAAAPASTDNLIITGSFTGGSSFTGSGVVLDVNSGLYYGNIFVTSAGSFSLTNFNLKLAGNIRIHPGGDMSGNANGSIEINCSSIGQYGIFVDGGLFQVLGTSKTTLNKLSADISSGATTSTLSSTPSGWTSGDLIAIASTTRTSTEAEVVTLSSTSVNSITHSATSFAHGGNSTTLVQADVANLTKAYKIYGTSASFPTFILVSGSNPIMYIQDVELYNIGANTTTQAGISIYPLLNSDTNSVRVINCVIRQVSAPAATAYGMVVNWNVTRGTLQINNNCIYNYSSFAFFNRATSVTMVSLLNTNVNNNVFLKTGGVRVDNFRVNFYNNSISSSNTSGASYVFTINTATDLANFDGNQFYSNNGNGLSLQVLNLNGTSSWTISNNVFWRNNGAGLATSRLTVGNLGNIFKIYSSYFFGNLTNHLFTQTTSGNILFDTCYFWGGSTLVTSTCFPVGQTSANSLQFNNCVFGRDYLGNSSPFSTAIYCANANGHNFSATLWNCTTNGTEYSTTEATVGTTTGIVIDNNVGVTSINHNQISGSNKQYQYAGIIQTDTSIFRSSAQSLRLIPQSTSFKTTTGKCYNTPLKANNTMSVSVYVRKSTSTGGETLYNGNQPRLMLRANPLLGTFVDTVVATASASAGVWEQLSYSIPSQTIDCVLQFYVDCDGSVGWVNVDDWSTNKVFATRRMDYWVNDAGSYVEPENAGPQPTVEVSIA